MQKTKTTSKGDVGMTQKPITVSALTAYIKSLLETDDHLMRVYLTGEISNLTLHRSGHVYFKLKDDKAVISAVMFRSSAARLRFVPQNGTKVVVLGRISVFEPNGNYQIYIDQMQPDGIGEMYLIYEQLKNKLDKEGLFDTAHKKPIPKLPERVGVITSPTGAAVRDIINILSRRCKLCDILLYPALVQGEGAEADLLKALDYFDAQKNVDVIIIGRGGGSLEDLWAFNSERLAYRIYNMSIPVISAVGHETDFTICDFVSDLRAPTPSAAAELATPDQNEILQSLSKADERMRASLKKQYDFLKDRYLRLASSRALTDADAITETRQMIVDNLIERLCKNTSLKISRAENTFASAAAKLDALSPLKVLGRGYIVAQNQNAKIIKSVLELDVGHSITLTLKDGRADCNVAKIEKGEYLNVKGN